METSSASRVKQNQIKEIQVVSSRVEVKKTTLKRIRKKIAKTIYKNHNNLHFPTKVCFEIAEQIEDNIVENAQTFEDYRNKIFKSIELIQTSEQFLIEMHSQIDKSDLIDWVKKSLPLKLD